MPLTITPAHFADIATNVRPALTARAQQRYNLCICEAEDAVGEAEANALFNLEAYDHQSNSGLAAWLWRLTEQASRRAKRHNGREQTISPTEWRALDLDSLPDTDEMEMLATLEARMGAVRLTKIEQDCLTLRIEGRPWREVARIVGRGESAVIKAVGRARVKVLSVRGPFDHLPHRFWVWLFWSASQHTRRQKLTTQGARLGRESLRLLR